MAPVDPEASTDVIVNKSKSHECSLDVNGLKIMVDRKIKENNRNGIDWFRLSLAAAPFVIGFFLYLSTVNTRLTVIELKQNEITEIKSDLKELRNEIINLRLTIEGRKP
jgi:hypothetical protein